MPFTPEAFHALFAPYNAWSWPLSAVLLVAALLLVSRITRGQDARGLWWLLAAMWAVNSVGYHALTFTQINPAAWAFAGLTLGGAGLFVQQALQPTPPAFRWPPGARGWAAKGLVVYALGIYPALGLGLGADPLALPLFGTAPCPTTIFTLGVLLATHPLPRRTLVAPVLWSVVGGSAVFLLGVPQDAGLIVAGLAGAFAGWTAPTS